VTIDTAGNVSAPTSLPAGTIATTVFGVSATDVFFVVGTTLYRQPLPSGTATTIALPGPPVAAALTGGYANGFFFVGNSGGACQALQDTKSTLDANASALSGAFGTATDGTSFAFRMIGPGNIAALHRIAAPGFALNGTPCDSGGFTTNKDFPVSVYGSNVAWIILFPLSTTPYQLNVAPIAGGICGTTQQANFGSSTSGSQVVGLISATDALVTPLVAKPTVTVGIQRAGDSTFSRTPVTVNMGSSGSAFPVVFVVGVEATTHYAVLVTKDAPALIKF
jgi:hypothetical protein